jgi:hypothetical protein
LGTLSFVAHRILVEVAGGIAAQMFIGVFGIVLLVGLLGSLHCTAAYRLGPWWSALRSSVLMTRVDWFGMIDAELGQTTADRDRQHRSLTDRGPGLITAQMSGLEAILDGRLRPGERVARALRSREMAAGV